MFSYDVFAVDKLYDELPLQCVTCGVRFPPDAKDVMQDHYDWHFRRNAVRILALEEKNRELGASSRCIYWYLCKTE